MANELNIKLAIENKKKFTKEISDTYESLFSNAMQKSVKKIRTDTTWLKGKPTKVDIFEHVELKPSKKMAGQLNEILKGQAVTAFEANKKLSKEYVESITKDLNLANKSIFKDNKSMQGMLLAQAQKSKISIEKLQNEYLTSLKTMYTKGTQDDILYAETAWQTYNLLLERAEQKIQEFEASGETRETQEEIIEKSFFSKRRAAVIEQSMDIYNSKIVSWGKNLVQAYLSWEAIKGSIVDVANIQSKLTIQAIAANKPISELYDNVESIAQATLDYDASATLVGVFANEGPKASMALDLIGTQLGQLSFLGTEIRDDVAGGIGAIVSLSKDGGASLGDFADSILSIANTETRSQIFSNLINTSKTMGKQGVTWLKRAGRGFSQLEKVMTGVGISSGAIRSIFSDIEKIKILDPTSPMGQLIMRFGGRESIFEIKKGNIKPAFDAMTKFAQQYRSAFTMDTPAAILQREQLAEMFDLTPDIMEAISQLANTGSSALTKQLKLAEAQRKGGKELENIYMEYAKTDPTYGLKLFALKLDDMLKSFGKEIVPYIPGIMKVMNETFTQQNMKDVAKSLATFATVGVPLIVGALKGVGALFGGLDFITGGGGNAIMGGLKTLIGIKIAGLFKWIFGKKLLMKVLKGATAKTAVAFSGLFTGLSRAWDATMKSGSMLHSIMAFGGGFIEGMFKFFSTIPTMLFDALFDTNITGFVDNMFDNMHKSIDVIFRDGIFGFFQDLWRIVRGKVTEMADTAWSIAKAGGDVLAVLGAAGAPMGHKVAGHERKRKKTSKRAQDPLIVGMAIGGALAVKESKGAKGMRGYEHLGIKNKKGINVNLTKSFGDDLQSALDGVPLSIKDQLQINYASRSGATQIKLFNAALEKEGYPAYGKPGSPKHAVGGVAFPGTSRHEKGLAVDIGGIGSLSPEDRRVLLLELKRYGLGRGQGLGIEKHHIERIKGGAEASYLRSAQNSSRMTTPASMPVASNQSTSNASMQSTNELRGQLNRVVNLLASIDNTSTDANKDNKIANALTSANIELTKLV